MGVCTVHGPIVARISRAGITEFYLAQRGARRPSRRCAIHVLPRTRAGVENAVRRRIDARSKEGWMTGIPEESGRGPHDLPAHVPPSHAHPDREAMIREAAYRLAERRGFAAGGEIEDWLAAEAEVDQRLAGEGRVF
jgi:Protein of unknown function (DUF2934)